MRRITLTKLSTNNLHCELVAPNLHVIDCCVTFLETQTLQFHELQLGSGVGAPVDARQPGRCAHASEWTTASNSAADRTYDSIAT